MIVLDTSVLSAVYRRRQVSSPAPRVVRRFIELVESDAPLAIPGVVLQEILSVVKLETEFQKLDDLLSGFPLLLASRQTHVRAAQVRNLCRAGGVAAATVDCLITAHVLLGEAELMTLDEDFVRIARHTELRLLTI